MRCPRCEAPDDRVVDSRGSDDATAIRRRRECARCQHRFTTFERIEEAPLAVVKRSGHREAFDRSKIIGGLVAATKNRPVTDAHRQDLAVAVEEWLRLDGGGDVSSQRVGLVVLEHLRQLDQVAYVRFASVYKEFDDPTDFEREVGLLTKASAPKGS